MRSKSVFVSVSGPCDGLYGKHVCNCGKWRLVRNRGIYDMASCSESPCTLGLYGIGVANLQFHGAIGLLSSHYIVSVAVMIGALLG